MAKLEEQIAFEGLCKERPMEKPVCLRKALGYCTFCDKEYDDKTNRLKCEHYTSI